MIITDDMGFNDHERINWLNLEPKVSMIANYSQFMATLQDKKYKDPDSGQLLPLVPFVNPFSISRYGNQHRTIDSEFVQTENADTKETISTSVDVAEKWMRELINLWRNYERFESGISLIKGFSDINVFTKEDKSGILKLNGKVLQDQTSQILKNSKKKRIANDQYNVGINMFFNTRDRLYHLEGYTLEWSAPGISHVTLALTRGVSWNAQGDYKFVDEADHMGNKSGAGDMQKDLAVSVITRK
jgi:hypothetical protein